jgi:hypothetical protein
VHLEEAVSIHQADHHLPPGTHLRVLVAVLGLHAEGREEHGLLGGAVDGLGQDGGPHLAGGTGQGGVLYLEVEQAEGRVLDDLVSHVLGEVLDTELELEGGFLLDLAAGRRDMGEGAGLTFWSDTFFSMLSQPSRPRESVNCRPKYLQERT